MSKQPTLTLIESLFSQSKDYIDNRLELYKLKAIDKTSSVIASVISGLALFIIFFLFFVVFNIGIALLIGDLVGKASYGFLIWAAFYLIVGLVIFFGRNKLFKTPVTGMIIRKFL
ncbi:MAG TPA: hypothetical protein VF623_00995 [Segetibacter sp.]|jgi:hypothetical protein